MRGVRFQWQTIVRRTGLAGLWLATLLIAQKRWSGQLTTGLSETIVVGTAGAAGLLSVLVMLVIAPHEERASRFLTRLWLSALPPFLTGLSLLPDASAAGPAGLSLGLMLTVLAPLLIGRHAESGSVAAATETEAVTVISSGINASVSSAFHEMASKPLAADVLSGMEMLERPSVRADVPSISATSAPAGPLESGWEPLQGTPSERFAVSRIEEPDADEINEDLIDESDQECPVRIGPDTRQWMTRTIQVDREVIEGGCRIEFSAGQKQAVLHLPFTPALSGIPEFECEAIDGSDVRFRITARLPYGIRMEISRSSGLDQCQTVELGYSASAPLQRQSAAA